MKTPAQNTNDPAHRPLVIEPGEAFRRLGGLDAPRAAAPQRFDVIVIGGGQAGLSVGYHLRERGLRFLILDASERIGDVWRRRWDSLRLFTPAKLDGLDGMRFPAPPDEFPTKDQMADYLEAYAARFELPVRTRARVERLFRRDGAYVIALAGGGELEADQVVVAMASYQRRRVPALAGELRPDIVQLHSIEYRGPSQLRDGGALVAGAGNSGAEIAAELGRGGRETWLAGPGTGEIPFRITGRAARMFLVRFLLRFVFHRVLTVRTPMGRRARPKILAKGGPLIRVKSADLTAMGVKRAPRVVSVRDGLPVLEDGRVVDVKNVIWCTGFEPGFSWIDLPGVAMDAHGDPDHDGGVARGAPGLYFVGLHFLYAMSSTMIHGVGRDAARIARAAASQRRAPLVSSAGARAEGAPRAG